MNHKIQGNNSCYQGDSTCFLIVKISLNSPEFPEKTNHNEPSVRGAEGAQRRHETTLYSFLPRLCGSKFFNVKPVPKPIDCALTRTVRTSGSMGQVLAVFQTFSLRTKGSTKLRISRLLSQN
jgi:hypothetical protein